MFVLIIPIYHMQILRDKEIQATSNEFQIQGWESKYLHQHPGLQHMSEARRKQQRRRSQLLASNWENLYLLRMSSITPHQTTASPVMSEPREKNKCFECLCPNMCYLFSKWKIAYFLLSWLSSDFISLGMGIERN